MGLAIRPEQNDRLLFPGAFALRREFQGCRLRRIPSRFSLELTHFSTDTALETGKVSTRQQLVLQNV
jgi:hypothetical protein